jgi:xylulokinase
MYWLGIDVGTGGTRALLLDKQGKIVSSCTAPHAEMRMERPLWAEQDPDDWWRATQLAIQGALREANTDGTAIQGIGFSGQMHGDSAQLDLVRSAQPGTGGCHPRQSGT